MVLLLQDIASYPSHLSIIGILHLALALSSMYSHSLYSIARIPWLAAALIILCMCVAMYKLHSFPTINVNIQVVFTETRGRQCNTISHVVCAQAYLLSLSPYSSNFTVECVNIINLLAKYLPCLNKRGHDQHPTHQTVTPQLQLYICRKLHESQYSQNLYIAIYSCIQVYCDMFIHNCINM